jgi:hypothetical protein
MITNFEFTHTIIYHLIYYIVIVINWIAILKSIIKRQISFLIGGTNTGIIMTYYSGFFIYYLVNSIMWYVISYLVSKYYYKSKGTNDQIYLTQYALNRIKKNDI